MKKSLTVSIGEWMGLFATTYGIFGHWWGDDIPTRTFSVVCGCAFYLHALVSRKREQDGAA